MARDMQGGLTQEDVKTYHDLMHGVHEAPEAAYMPSSLAKELGLIPLDVPDGCCVMVTPDDWAIVVDDEDDE